MVPPNRSMEPSGYIRLAINTFNMTDTTTPPIDIRTRPTFLTVLCILSFLGCGLGLYGGISDLLSNKNQEALEEATQRIDEAKAQMGDDAASGFAGNMMDAAIEMAQKAAEHAKEIGLSKIVLALIEALGVLLMWNLRKSGFWLYVLSMLGGLAVPLIFLGTNLASILSIGVAGLIGIVFVVLYAMNLKHMH